MKVKALIDMLAQCPEDMDVWLAYDSMVCRYPTERQTSFIVHKTIDEFSPKGVYLCAMEPNTVPWNRKEVGGKPIPSRQKEAKK